jgi:hypothetical protein
LLCHDDRQSLALEHGDGVRKRLHDDGREPFRRLVQQQYARGFVASRTKAIQSLPKREA